MSIVKVGEIYRSKQMGIKRVVKSISTLNDEPFIHYDVYYGRKNGFTSHIGKYNGPAGMTEKMFLEMSTLTPVPHPPTVTKTAAERLLANLFR